MESRIFGRLVFICIFGLWLVGAGVDVARAAEILGRVVPSAPDAVVEFARIRVEGPTAHSERPSAGGAFRLVGLEAGTYVVRVTLAGHRDFETEIELAPGESVDLVIELEPGARRMERVDVTAEALDRERDVQTGLVALGGDELASLPAFGESDPIRALQMLPGVQAASDVSSGLYVRGGGPDQTLILLDEVPIYNPTHAFGLFSTFNSDAVDQVKLYKGAYPAEYGGRLGAVLDVRNRQGESTKLQGSGALSTITGRGLIEGPVGDGSFLVTGRRTYLEPLLSAIRTDDNQIPSYYFYDLNGSLSLNPAPADRFRVRGYLGQDDLFFDLDEDSFIDIRWGNRALSAKYDREFRPSVLGSVLVSGTEYASKTSVELFTTPASFENRLRDVTARADLQWRVGASNRLRAGSIASLYDFEFRQRFNREVQVAFDSRPFDGSLYVEDEISFGRSHVVRAGLRGRYFSEGDRLLAEPRLSTGFPLGGGLRGKLGGGLYHQYLQLITTEGFSGGDFYLPIDETAEPGRSWQGVGGIEWPISPTYFASLEGYYTDLSNLVAIDNRRATDADGFDTETVFMTDGTGYASGAELFLHKRRGTWKGWVGYTLGWTRRRFADLNGGRAFPPKYDRRHDVNVVWSWDRGSWKYGAAFIYATGQAFTPATARYYVRNPATGVLEDSGEVLPGTKNSARLLPYHRLDLSVKRDFQMFGRDAQWVIHAFNVYNRRNEWFIQYNTDRGFLEVEVVKMLPIIPSLGIEWDF